MDFILETCRCCLAVGVETNSFTDEVDFETRITLSEIYEKVIGIKIYSEGLEQSSGPLCICHPCTDRLLTAFEFICFVEKNESEFQRWIPLEADGCQEEDEGDNRQEKEEYADIEPEDNTSEDVAENLEIVEEYMEMTELEGAFEEHSQHFESEVVVETHQMLSSDSLETSDEGGHQSEVRATTTITKSAAIGSRLASRNTNPHHYKCEDCFRSFAKEETLARHRKNAHTFLTTCPESTTGADGSDNGSVRFKCPFCPRDFVRRDYYIRHLVNVHPEQANVSAEDRESVNRRQQQKKGLCPHCGESFSRNSLSVHIRRHTGENPYPCNVCLKSFPRRQDLNVHFRQHTGERPDICPVCGKSFSRSNKLTRHMRIHTGERPYKCSKCPRSFIQSNDLKIHLRRHTGEKPYKCAVCSEAFICGAALRIHRRRFNHHVPNQVEDDPFINWRVSTRSNKRLSSSTTNKVTS